jgi:hypothetical protein
MLIKARILYAEISKGQLVGEREFNLPEKNVLDKKKRNNNALGDEVS